MRVLLLDIELSPLIVTVWSLANNNYISPDKIMGNSEVLCWAGKWLGEDKTYFSSKKTTSKARMLKAMYRMLEQADVVVTFNGNAFDLKILNKEFALQGWGPPSPYKSVDMLLALRKKFRFTSNKLGYVTQMLGLGEKTPHTGYQLWLDCMNPRSADYETSWATMERYNCLTPDHKVLTEDLRWLPLGDVKVGQTLLGFDEERQDTQKARRYRPAKVLANARQMAEVYEVTMSNGDRIKCTADHKWLVPSASINARTGGMQGKGYNWVTTEQLYDSSSVNLRGKKRTGAATGGTWIAKPLEVIEEDKSKEAGWLAGMLDGEGCLSPRKPSTNTPVAGGFAISVTQKEGPELEKLYAYINKFNSGTVCSVQYDKCPSASSLTKLSIKCVTVQGKFSDKLAFLQRVRPERLISKFDFSNLPQVEARGNFVQVVSIKSLGKLEVVALETSTGTYVADGYLMHNCQDVALLESLYNRLKGWIPNHPNFSAHQEGAHVCPGCGGTHLERRGFLMAISQRYQRYKCNDCGKWSRARSPVKVDRANQLVGIN